MAVRGCSFPPPVPTQYGRSVDADKLYIVDVSKLHYSPLYRPYITYDFYNVKKRLAVMKNNNFVDALNGKIYYSYGTVSFTYAKKHRNDFFAIKNILLQQSKYKVTNEKLSVEEIEQLENQINNKNSTKDDINTAINDPILKMIIKSKNLMNEYIINKESKIIILKKLEDLSKYYLENIPNLTGDRYYPLRLDLIRKMVYSLAKIDFLIMSYPKRNRSLETDIDVFNKQFNR